MKTSAFTPLFCLLCLLLLVPDCVRAATTTTLWGETLTWEFQGVRSTPDPLFCTKTSEYYSVNNTCSYGVTDIPYGVPVIFTASVTPSSPDEMRALRLQYRDQKGVYRTILGVQNSFTDAPLALNMKFYIPSSAVAFELTYQAITPFSNKYISVKYPLQDFNPDLAQRFGGADIDNNNDTNFCGDTAQPGSPPLFINNQKGKKPDGPGG